MRTGDGRQLRQGRWTGGPAASATRDAPVSPLLRAAGVLLLAVHLALVGWFALRPLPVDWVYDANLHPLASIRRALTSGSAEAYRHLAVSLLLMAPLGVLLPLAGGRVRAGWLPSLLRTVGAAALLCTALEFVQNYVPGHVLDVDDILLNLLGVTLAHLAVVPAARARLRHRAARPRRAAPAPPPRQHASGVRGPAGPASYEVAPTPGGR
ncbi:VanZ family protein [Peterkaempfera sp. SMS 1(5)a]|uniref:VanZ family protein n=1 Tax=Peterkaempfera podocarpi TaxID=3232308 RepID=UPI003670AEDF